MANEDEFESTNSAIARANEFVVPHVGRRAFHCPHCGVLSHQTWQRLHGRTGGSWHSTHSVVGQCINCSGLTYWITEEVEQGVDSDTGARIVFPFAAGNAPLAHPDFPTDPRRDYDEARNIVDRSPRGAAALLRLAAQKLCGALGESGKDINQDVGALVKRGLPPGVQMALDSLRVVGNNAVHPGQMDVRDDRETANALFGLLNLVVEQMITRPAELEAIYAKLPAEARAQIATRDAQTSRGGKPTRG